MKDEGECETGTGKRLGYREILYSFLIWRERLEVRRTELNHNLPSSGGRHVQLTSISLILLYQSELLSNGREAFTSRVNCEGEKSALDLDSTYRPFLALFS